MEPCQQIPAHIFALLVLGTLGQAFLTCCMGWLAYRVGEAKNDRDAKYWLLREQLDHSTKNIVEKVTETKNGPLGGPHKN